MQLFSGMDYLRLDIAGSFGLDKLTWDNRLAWFKNNESKLEQLVEEAESPAMFYAGIQAYRQAQQGIPSGYPISLDSTASCFQLLAILTGDREAASLCNVVDTGTREDAYTRIYEALLAKTGGQATVTRDDVKRSCMTALYSSTEVPKQVFGEGELYAQFMQTMEEEAPGAWEANTAFLGMWDSTTDKYSWIMPDNFHVHIKIMNQKKETIHFAGSSHEIKYKVHAPSKYGRSLGPNLAHSCDAMIVREMQRRCNYDVNQVKEVQRILFMEWNDIEFMEMNEENLLCIELWERYCTTGYLSARILQVINRDNIMLLDRSVILELIDSLPSKPFEILTIHDCFECLCNYGNDLRKQYNLQLSLIAKSSMLQDLLRQITGNEKIVVNKIDKNLWKDCLTTNYALS